MKTKRKSSFLVTIIFASMLLIPLAFNSTITAASGAEPSPGGEKYIIYSETTDGEQIPDINWNGWNWPEMALGAYTADPYEGAESQNLTLTGAGWGWGMGWERAALDLSKFATGYLVFAVKSDYPGIFDAGFQGAGNAFVSLVPGTYGYDNDSVWHQVVIPVADLLAANPSADISAATSVFALFDDSAPTAGTIIFDDIYWQATSPRALVYSETTDGEQIPDINWNGWNWPEMALGAYTADPYEGTESQNLTLTGAGWGWGMGWERAALDLSRFATGYLVFAVKSDYPGIFDAGFQGAGNAFVSLVPGTYGYDNDSVWHQVVIPVADLLAANPSADLSAATSVFVLFDDSAPTAGTIIFDDIYWVEGPPRAVIYSETTDGEQIPDINWNGWNWPEMALGPYTADPYEGTESQNLTLTGAGWGWGLGWERAALDLSRFAYGSLKFAVKSDYPGIFDAGFQGAGNAFVSLVPGTYGYDNDSVWHQVVIPVADLLAANPSADLSAATSVFVLFDDSAPTAGTIIFDDIYWEEPDFIEYGVFVDDAALALNSTNADLELTYTFREATGGPDLSEILWYKNDVVQSTYENLTVVPTSELIEADVWNATITPYNGTETGDVVSVVFTVPDLSPVVSDVVLSIDSVSGNLTLTYTFSDPHGDPNMSIIEWVKNDSIISTYENMTYVPASAIADWDLWYANVTAYDGNDYGATVSSNSKQFIPPPLADPNFLLIFSETSPGVPHDELEWVDWAGTATLDLQSGSGAAEGNEYYAATYLGTAGWWGISAATVPRGSGDLSSFATGTLHFMIKTTYSGGLRFGFNNQGGVDAFITVHSGEYGYVNDGEWHQVSIPVADIHAQNTAVDITTIENVFVISGVAGEMDTEPVYFDDAYYEKGGTPSITDADIYFDPIDGGLTLEYDYIDPQGDADQSTIRWYKNGELVVEFNDMTNVPETAFVTGDVWYAIVTPFDGTNTGLPVQSNNATIGAGYEPEETETPGIPGFRISTFFVFTVIAVVFSIRKRKK